MKMYAYYSISLLLSVSLIPACSLSPVNSSISKDHDTLTIYPDGTMRLRGRPVAAEDIIIYPDGFGGERAAIKVRLDPLHPDFYRDTIIVQRINPEDSDN